MTDRLLHDPKTKAQIKNMLYNFLYGHVREVFQKRLEDIITRNMILTNAQHKSFTYKGIFYSCDNTSPPRRMNKLVPQLVPDMEGYLREVTQLNNTELPYVLGFIDQVLNSTNNLQDYLRIFPKSVHKPIQDLINSCPCHDKNLSDEEVQQLQEQNNQSISLMKQRMAINLLI